MHEGIDIAASSGTPIWAAASGTVIHAGWLGGYGNLVVVDHGNGLATAYAHASAILVGVGQEVSQGETLSFVGSTGNSSGPHLHFEVRVNGAAVGPVGCISNGHRQLRRGESSRDPAIGSLPSPRMQADQPARR